MYPNPVTDMLTIELNNPSQLRIIDIMGKLVVDQPFDAGKSVLSTSLWLKGLYIISVQDKDGKIKTYKLIKS